jgi:ABC-2 type transport system permease protein
MQAHAAKSYAGGKRREARARVDIPIDTGVSAEAADGEQPDEKPLYLEKYPVKDGDSTISVVVDGKRWEAGIDPFNELVDRVSDDSCARVTIE